MTTTPATKPRTVYIPYMCDHVYVLAAALEALGVPAEVLPPPDEESLAVGLEFCKGRECLPCFTTTGDLVRRARQPGFDPGSAAFLMPTAIGSCRFGQYNVLQRQILTRLGFGAVHFLSPSAEDNYQSLGGDPARMRRLVWDGVVAADLLQKLLHEHRPYEVTPGETDRLYQQCLERIVAAVRDGGGRRIPEALTWTATRFAALPVDRSQRRPVIGLVGEIYVRFSAFTNGEIIRRVEAAGGEVALATMMEWLYFCNGWDYRHYYRRPQSQRDLITSFLTNAYQRKAERTLIKPVKHLLRHPEETPIVTLLNNIRPHFSPRLHSEAILTMGKAIDYARQGLSGIINILPFSCMPGLIATGMAPRLRADLGGIPWLDVICDVQASTNIQTRLEAFLFQAQQFQLRTAGRGQLASGHGA